MEENYKKVIDALIEDNGLSEMDEHEAECICLAWLLKTKMYMMSETSREWSIEGKQMLNNELSWPE